MSDDEQYLRYKFRRDIEELESKKGRATEMITLYVPSKKVISDVTGYLRNESSQSSNIKSKSTRKNVMAAIDSIVSNLKNYKSVPENGMVFFTGHVATGKDQTRMFRLVVDQPPQAIPTFLYRCDSRFHVDMLKDMLKDRRTLGLITVDRSEATIGKVQGKSVKVINHFNSLVPSKHHKGGQSAQRFMRLIEEAAHNFYKKIANAAEDAFLDDETELTGILVGGPGATKDYFVNSGYLHHELQKKVMDTFDTGYTDESGLRELMTNAGAVLHGLDLVKEKELVGRLMQEITRAERALATYGETYVRKALEIGAVETLLLSDSLRKYRVKLVCPEGHIEEKTVMGNPESDDCSECSSTADVEEKMDMVEELTELASTTGASVEMISAESEEGATLLRAFGGLGALLRFPIA